MPARSAALWILMAPVLPAGLLAQTEPDRVATPERDACARLVVEGTAAGRAGELEDAERALEDARTLCPGNAQVFRQLAGLRFEQRRYDEAAQLSGRLAELAPEDDYAWQVLAASRFLADDRTGALRAWNRVDRPRVGRVRLEGLARTPPGAVRRALAISEEDLVTPEALARAERRILLLPSVRRARVGYRPEGEGAHVEVHVSERPSFPSTGPEVLGHALRAVGARRIAFAAAGPLGGGELWRADWAWRAPQRSVELALAAPGGPLPGVWTLTAGERSGAHRFPDEAAPAGPTGEGAVHRDSHRFARVEASDWASGNLLWELGVSLDRWAGRGGFGGLRGALELRWPQEASLERAALRLSGQAWRSPSTGEDFGSKRVQAVARSSPGAGGPEWIARSGFAHASGDSPAILWATAGADWPSDALLRAHPILDGDGVIRGPFSGPRLAHAGVELRHWLHDFGLLRIGPAVFVEGARVRAPSPAGEAELAVDVGAGLRVDVPVLGGALRADLAYGIVDGETAGSLGWMPGWPGWW